MLYVCMRVRLEFLLKLHKSRCEGLASALQPVGSQHKVRMSVGLVRTLIISFRPPQSIDKYCD